MKRIAILALAAAACETGGQQPEVTFYRDVLPVLEGNCTGCHVEGGIAPFPLGTYEEAAIYADMIAHVTAERIMPPWPPDPACNDYEGERLLPAGDIALLQRWAEQGAPQGDPADAPPPPESKGTGLSRVDLRLEMPEPYLPVVTRDEPDDYRCFVFDWPLEEPAYVTGFSTTPGTPAVVHHVIAFLGLPGNDEFDELDAAEDGPGYTCFGGPGTTDPTRVGWLGAWAPGTIVGDLPPGTGLKVEPGSKVILQVHYNGEAAGALPDQTGIDLKIDASVEKEGVVLPIANPDWLRPGGMPIPAGEASYPHSFAVPPSLVAAVLGAPVSGDLLLHGAALHMHTRGRTGTIRHLPADGPEACVLDVPRWDFHWQGFYRLREPLLVKAGESIELACTWDTRGMKQDLTWGEGTSDEMCLGVLFVSEP